MARSYIQPKATKRAGGRVEKKMKKRGWGGGVNPLSTIMIYSCYILVLNPNKAEILSWKKRWRRWRWRKLLKVAALVIFSISIMVLLEIHERFKGHFLNELRVSFNSDIYHFQMSLIHLFKKMKHENLGIIGYWVIGVDC